MQNQEQTKLQYGGFFVRLFAYFLDSLIIGCILSVIKLPLFIVALINPEAIIIQPFLFKFSVADIVLYLLSALYFILMTYYRGTTLGKKVLGLRVISSDDQKLTLLNVIYRETIGRYLSSAILFVGYILIGVDSEKKGLHDIMCNTRVIYDFGTKRQTNNVNYSTNTYVSDMKTSLPGPEPKEEEPTQERSE